MYDREEGEYIQRFLCAELTDREAELAGELFASIQSRKIAAWKEKGWCDDNEESCLTTPLTEFCTDWAGDQRHRFAFQQDFLLEDTESDNARGWRGL